MTPEILHLIFTGIGLVLGWYIKHQSIRIPPEILTYLESRLGDQKARQAHTILQDLLTAGKTVLSVVDPTPSPPPAGKG